MARRDGAFTFTYSRRNQDIRELMDEKASSNKSFVRTDYFCEAVRFYEKHKDNIILSDEDIIKELVMDALIAMKINVEEKQEDDKVKRIDIDTTLTDLDEEMEDLSLDDD